MTPSRFLFMLIVGCPAMLASSWLAPGNLDASFGVSGRVTTSIAPRANALVLQPDGKLVAAAYVNGGSTYADFALVRFDGDGSLDAGFGTAGTVTTDFAGEADVAYALVLQPDGKIVAAGASGFNLTDFALARYNADGTLDASFGSGGKVTTDFAGAADQAVALVLQPDGKLVAAGVTRDSGSVDFALARYNANGTLDTSFGTGGKVTTDFGGRFDEARALVLRADGKLVAAGVSNSGGFFGDFALARYDADGTLDASFGTGGTVTTDFGGHEQAAALVVQPDGRVVAAGVAQTGAMLDVIDFALARYNDDGTLDASFGSGGKVTTDFAGSADEAQALVLQPDGKLVAAGRALTDSYDFALARYDTGGTLDASFGSGGKVTTDFGSSFDEALALVLQPDGKLVAGGEMATDTFDLALLRYNPDGTRDACASAPEAGCRLSGRSLLVLKTNHPNRQDHFTWQWRQGAATTLADFGSVLSTSGYQICLYDPSGPRLGVGVPAGGTCDGQSCWRARPSGLTYHNAALDPDGIFKVLLKPGADGNAKILVTGKGAKLHLPAPPFASLPLTVQIKRPDGGLCWEATYSTAITNEAGQFKAKSE